MPSPQLIDRIQPDPSELRWARARLRSWLEAKGVDDDDAYDVVLVFSELATNAVKAAQRSDLDRDVLIDIVGHLDPDGCVLLKVRGPGDALDPARLSSGLPADDAETGRGFAIARALSDKLRSQRNGTTTTVEALLRVSEPVFRGAGRAPR